MCHDLWFSLNPVTYFFFSSFFFSQCETMREKIFATLLGVFCSEKRENVTISKDTKWGNLYSKHTSVLARKGEGKKNPFSVELNIFKIIIIILVIRVRDNPTQWSSSTMSVKMFLSPCVHLHTDTHIHPELNTHTDDTHRIGH